MKPDLPALPGMVDTPDRGEDVLDLMTADLLAQALDCTHRFGSFHMAFSGERRTRRPLSTNDVRSRPSKIPMGSNASLDKR